MKYLIIVTSSLGLVISFLLVFKSPSTSLPLCELGQLFSCGAVLNYPHYSKIFGIDNSLLGVLYFSFFLALFIFTRGTPYLVARLAFFLSFIFLLGSAYLFWISVTVIKALCPYCVAVYVVNFINFLALGLNLRRWQDKTEVFKPLVKASLVSFGVFTVAYALKLGFFTFDEKISLKDILVEDKNLHLNHILTEKEKELIKGKKYVFVEFLDPLCFFCNVLVYWQKEFKSEEAVFIKRYFPLDKDCNEALRESLHPLACELSKLLLCVDEKTVDAIFDGLIKNGQNFEDFEELSTFLSYYVSKTQIEQCLVNQEISSTLSMHIKQGLELGIRGTPTLYLNGKLVSFEKHHPSVVFRGFQKGLIQE